MIEREPRRRRGTKREVDVSEMSEGELVALLRRRSWAWLAGQRRAADPVEEAPPVDEGVAPPVLESEAPPVVVTAPVVTAPLAEAGSPRRRRGPKRAAVPEGVVELRRRAWAWFAPHATGEAAAGSHQPLRLVTPLASASSGNVVLMHLKGVLEALVFASEHPLPAKELARLARTDVKIARMLLGELVAEYHGRGFRLDEVAGGYVFRTSPLFAPFVREQVAKKPVRMSRAQLETLAIVAYRQPITRPEVDEVRGVDSGAVMKSLLERELVRIIGKKDEPGRPMLYGTTGAFLEFFGLKALGDLPTLREFTELNDESKRTYERELGEDAPEPGASPQAGEGLMGGEGEMRRGSVDLGGQAPPETAAFEQDGPVTVEESAAEIAPQVEGGRDERRAEEGVTEEGQGEERQKEEAPQKEEGQKEEGQKEYQHEEDDEDDQEEEDDDDEEDDDEEDDDEA